MIQSILYTISLIIENVLLIVFGFIFLGIVIDSRGKDKLPWIFMILSYLAVIFQVSLFAFDFVNKF